MIDADVLEQVLAALARGGGGQAGQRAWMTLPSMTARICGRFSKEARAVAAACAGDKPDPAGLSGMAALLAERARTDPRFASILVPWLAAARILLAPGDGIVYQASENRDREGDPGRGQPRWDRLHRHGQPGDEQTADHHRRWPWLGGGGGGEPDPGLLNVPE